MRNLVLLFVVLLAACQPSQPQNIDDVRKNLVVYHDDGAYGRAFEQMASRATGQIVRKAKGTDKPAIILDIDETSLSNWPEMAANDFATNVQGPCSHLPKGPCGHHAWQAMGRDAPLLPMLNLFKEARAHNVAVFFITGRDETLRAATERNLRAAGYDGWTKLIMRPAGSTTPSATDYKAPERAKIEAEGYKIIANIGDQPSDLAGGHADTTYLMPNPWYRIP